jgi:uncharacterized coiled-coil protein SlyX
MIRAPRLWARLRGGTPAPGLERLEERVAHLEAQLEGLQDAFYRQSTLHDKELGELRARIEPERLARDLSDDARKRGL